MLGINLPKLTLVPFDQIWLLYVIFDFIYVCCGTEYNIGKCYKQGRDHSTITLRRK